MLKRKPLGTNLETLSMFSDELMMARSKKRDRLDVILSGSRCDPGHRSAGLCRQRFQNKGTPLLDGVCRYLPAL
jgi:hypothetical protein